MRRFPEGEIFHICNKSIANYPIFKDLDNSFRFIQILDFYNDQNIQTSLSSFLKKNSSYSPKLLQIKENCLIKFLTYCIMPDHYHLLIKILQKNSFLQYINNIENSFTRFFNINFKRKGPLWQSSFRSVRIKSNDQLLHVSRYVNINPITSSLVDRPEKWIYSSYKDYLNDDLLKNYLTEISINNSIQYKKFCENRIDYQKKLKLIKRLILE